MYGPAKAGILIVASVVVLGLLAPLITLGIDLYENPRALSYMVVEEARVNQTHVRASITLMYEGRVPLHDFTLALGNTAVRFGTVTPGNHTVTLVMPEADLKSNTTVMKFRVAYYTLSIRVERGAG